MRVFYCILLTFLGSCISTTKRIVPSEIKDKNYDMNSISLDSFIQITKNYCERISPEFGFNFGTIFTNKMK